MPSKTRTDDCGKPGRLFEPSGAAEHSEKIQRSLFIGHIEPCHSETEAKNFLGRVQTAYRDATHNCWAYLMASSAVTEYSSDAGEPAGTAGRPILAALKRSGMVNVMAVVTRYFGGVKLGVRGLIEAYGGVTARTLEAVTPVERILTCPFAVSLAYASIGTLTRLLEDHGAGGSLKWVYGAEVSVTADVPVLSSESLSRALDEMQARGVILGWGKN